MVEGPHTTLKVIVIVHFILTVWASMMQGAFLNVSYVYMNAFILAFGVWGIICPESVDAVFMFFLLNVMSILMDIIFLGIFATHGQAVYEPTNTSYRNDYRFSLGMAILNLLLKPLSSFVLYRIYQDRMGVQRFPEFGIIRVGRNGTYENIDQSSATPRSVETAGPYVTVDKRPLA